jgi:DNA-binding CsgD family transcriptional regulator
MQLESMISDFYAAASGRVDWRLPLDQLAAHLGLWGVQMVGVDKRSGGLTFSAEGGPASPDAALDYIRHYHSSNPRISYALATPVGEFMHCHEYCNESFVATNSFYQDYLIPHGGRYLTSMKLVESDELVFMGGLMRGQGSAPLSDEDLPVLRLVQHHLSEAVKNFIHLRVTYAELGMARELLARFERPMLLVDEARGIWHRNEAANEMLRQADLLREQSGFLVCRKGEDNDAFTAALHELKMGAQVRDRIPARKAVPLIHSDGQRSLLLLSAVLPEQCMGAFGMSPRALVIVHRPSLQQDTLDPFIVAECFDLTPAEARVAIQVAKGASAKEIAKRHGVSPATVRTQLQKVFDKVGVDKQMELSHVLLNLP